MVTVGIGVSPLSDEVPVLWLLRCHGRRTQAFHDAGNRIISIGESSWWESGHESVLANEESNATRKLSIEVNCSY